MPENHEPGFEHKGLMSDGQRWWLNSGLWMLLFGLVAVAATAVESLAAQGVLSMAAAGTILFWSALGYVIGAHRYNAYGRRLIMIAGLVTVMAGTLALIPSFYGAGLALVGASVEPVAMLAAVGVASFLFFFMVIMNQYG